MKKKLLIIISIITTTLSFITLEAAVGEFQPMVVQQFIQEAKKNTNWKVAFATAKHEQIVFMNISSITNPNNEIGMEVHNFDQVILVVDGRAKAILNGKLSVVQEGDMIFVPEGTHHNVINLNQDQPLKVISFYSDTDIPKGSVYKTKADEQPH